MNKAALVFFMALVFSNFSCWKAYGETTDQWVLKSSMKDARYNTTTVVLNGKIYAIGGMGSNGPLSSVEEFDPISNSWSTKASINQLRTTHTTEVLNDKLYAI